MFRYIYAFAPNILIFGIFFLFNFSFRTPLYFFDYDSVKNYTILQEFQQGNFQNLFYHASPLLYIVLWLGNYIFSLEILLQIIHAVALTIWVVLCKDIFLFSPEYGNKEMPIFFKLGFLVVFIFLLVTSYFLWGMGDYVAMETLSVLLSGFLFYFYLKSFKETNKKNLVRVFGYFQVTAFLLGLLYTLNYKAVMLLPIFLLVEIIYFLYERPYFSPKKYLISLGWAVSPIIFFIFFGLLLGVSFLQYPKIIAFTFLMSSGEKVEFGRQILGLSDFYVQWLIKYENNSFFIIILFLGVVFLLLLMVLFLFLVVGLFFLLFFQLPLSFQKTKTLKKTQAFHKTLEEFISMKTSLSSFLMFLTNTEEKFILKTICYFVIFFTLIMSFLPTAPRGLVFVYPFYFLFLFIILFLVFSSIFNILEKNKNMMELFIERFLKLSLFLLFISFMCLGIYFGKKKELLFNKHQNTYPQIAEYLHQQNINEIATTQSIQILPYTSKYNIKIYPLTTEKDLLVLQEKRKKERLPSIAYILVDDYCKILNTEENFASFYGKNVLKTWTLPSLSQDLLFYEHSEFTKLDFGQTTERIKQHKYLLKAQLIKINEN